MWVKSQGMRIIENEKEGTERRRGKRRGEGRGWENSKIQIYYSLTW